MMATINTKLPLLKLINQRHHRHPFLQYYLSVSHPALLNSVCIFIHYGNVLHSIAFIGVIKMKPTQSVHS